MKTLLIPLLATLVDLLRSRASLQLEMLSLRQQLAMVASYDGKRLRFCQSERIFWVWLYRFWPGLPTDAGNLQARHADPLASEGFSVVLDVDIPPPARWPSIHRSRSARAYPDDVPK